MQRVYESSRPGGGAKVYIFVYEQRQLLSVIINQMNVIVCGSPPRNCVLLCFLCKMRSESDAGTAALESALLKDTSAGSVFIPKRS